MNETADSSQMVPASKEVTPETSVKNLFSGEELTLIEASEFTRSSLARVIVLAGPSESGKTTLLSSLFNCLQKGPLGEYSFAGSRSLIAFDRRSFPSTVASNRETPATPRTQTSLENIKFLHLSLCKSKAEKIRHHMLFTDISGENFRLAMDYSEQCRKLWVLKRTDHFALFVDGEKLVNVAQRHEAQSSCETLLRRCLETEMLGVNSFVDVIFSKMDVILSNSNKQDAFEFMAKIEKDFLRFVPKLGRIRFHKIAAQPKMMTSLGSGHGLRELLPSWIEETPLLSDAEDVPFERAGGRIFLNFSHS